MSPTNQSNKILHIVRHGKALQDYHSIDDIDRPLVEKGILMNMAMAERLKDKYVVPNIIISSPAARALHTALIFARISGYPAKRILVDDALYMEGESAALDILYGLPDNINYAMLVAHNPDMTRLANAFLRPPIDSLPTSGVVSLRFNTMHWNMLLGNVVSGEIDFPNRS